LLPFDGHIMDGANTCFSILVATSLPIRGGRRWVQFHKISVVVAVQSARI
jgi:hypothetical protein